MNNKPRNNSLLPLLILLTLPILAALAATTTSAAGLRLIYANDNLGELDGCG